MKKAILILTLMAFSLVGISQTLIHTDVLLIGQDTVYMEWSHEKYIDSDSPSALVSRVLLTKKLVTSDTTIISPTKSFLLRLNESDSLKNPAGSNYYSYEFVKNYIYTQGQDMKYTLSKWQVLNWVDRYFE